MTCDPNQSDFLAVTKVDLVQNKSTVQGLQYIVGRQYAYGMYDSCKDVQGVGGSPAIQTLCNTDKSHCSPEKLLDYLGDNPQNPLKVTFNITTNKTYTINETEYYPMDVQTLPCNESCNCQDCQASCPPLPPDVKPYHWRILGIDAVFFIAACIFACFLIVFGTAQIWKHLVCDAPTLVRDETLISDEPTFMVVNNHTGTDNAENSPPKMVTRSDISCYSKMRAWVDGKFEKAFEKLGLFCACYPVWVLLIGLGLCVAMSCGILKSNVITDPVELWSAPNSRARQEKDYYDENFT